jgi:sec-independent protein translocase protein TatA
MIGDVGMSELLVIFLIALILFGADRIPALAKGLGKGIREFKRIVNNANDEIQRAIDVEDTMPPKRMSSKHASTPVKKQDVVSENEFDDIEKEVDSEETSPPTPVPSPDKKNDNLKLET